MLHVCGAGVSTMEGGLNCTKKTSVSSARKDPVPLLEQRALVRDSRALCTLSVCQDGKEASLERWSAERAMVRTSPTAFWGVVVGCGEFL